MPPIHETPPTILGHSRLPYPRGTLMTDTSTNRLGELRDVIEERSKDTGRVLTRTAYLRPRGGGVEWEAPLTVLALVQPVDGNG